MGSLDALKSEKVLQFQYIWGYRDARAYPGPTSPLFQATAYFYLQPRETHKASTPCIPPVLKHSAELMISILCIHIVHVLMSFYCKKQW